MERSSGYYREQVGLLGPGCAQWAQAVVDERGVGAVRILQWLLALAKEHPAAAINSACAEALSYHQLRLRDVRNHIERPDRQEHFQFMDAHALIRPMDVYGQFLETQTQEIPS